MTQATDRTTFFVIGYIGTGRSKDDYFESGCIAKDRAAAITLMAETIPMLNPTGVTSLAEMKRIVQMLEKVRDGQLPAPSNRHRS